VTDWLAGWLVESAPEKLEPGETLRRFYLLQNIEIDWFTPRALQTWALNCRIQLEFNAVAAADRCMTAVIGSVDVFKKHSKFVYFGLERYCCI
jgi:hypothetical protein